MSRNISRAELGGASDSDRPGLKTELHNLWDLYKALYLIPKNEDKTAYLSSDFKCQDIIYAKIAKSLPGVCNMLNEQLHCSS